MTCVPDLPDLPDDHVHLVTRAQWRDWLAEHHDRGRGVWLVSFRRGAGPVIGYQESVEEALCFGWVDSTTRVLDERRGAMWFSPRRRGSPWARSNRERVARLEAAGLIAPAGRRVIEAAKADGSWSLLESVEALQVPADLAAALDALPPAREHFDAFPPGGRRAILGWIATAKRPATRAARIRTTAELAQVNQRADQPRRPGH